MIDISLLVEAKCERHDIVLAMFWTSVIVDVPVWNPNPEHKEFISAVHRLTFFYPTIIFNSNSLTTVLRLQTVCI